MKTEEDMYVYVYVCMYKKGDKHDPINYRPISSSSSSSSSF